MSEDAICEACQAVPDPERPKYIKPADITLEALKAIYSQIARFHGAGPRHQLDLTRFVGNYSFDRKDTQECSYSGHRHFRFGFLMYSKCGILLQLGADCTRHVTNLEEFHWLQQRGRNVRIVELQIEAVPEAKRRVLEAAARGRRCMEQRDALRRIAPELHDALVMTVAAPSGTEGIRRRKDRYLVTVPDPSRTQEEVESGREIYKVRDQELIGVKCFEEAGGLTPATVQWWADRAERLEGEIQQLQAGREADDQEALDALSSLAEDMTELQRKAESLVERAEQFWTLPNLAALSYASMFEIVGQRKLSDREERKRRALLDKLSALAI